MKTVEQVQVRLFLFDAKEIVTMRKNDGGFVISCPRLKGCHSQGNTPSEAIENIKDAIEAYKEAVGLSNQVTFSTSQDFSETVIAEQPSTTRHAYFWSGKSS